MTASLVAPPRRRITSLEMLCGVLVLALLAQGSLIQLLDIADYLRPPPCPHPPEPYEF